MGFCRGRVFGRHVHQAGRIVGDASAIPCRWVRETIAGWFGLGCRRSGLPFGSGVPGGWAARRHLGCKTEKTTLKKNNALKQTQPKTSTIKAKTRRPSSQNLKQQPRKKKELQTTKSLHVSKQTMKTIVENTTSSHPNKRGNEQFI